MFSGLRSVWVSWLSCKTAQVVKRREKKIHVRTTHWSTHTTLPVQAPHRTKPAPSQLPPSPPRRAGIASPGGPRATYISRHGRAGRPCAGSEGEGTAGSCSPSGTQKCSCPEAQRRCTCGRESWTSLTSGHTSCAERERETRGLTVVRGLDRRVIFHFWLLQKHLVSKSSEPANSEAQ